MFGRREGSQYLLWFRYVQPMMMCVVVDSSQLSSAQFGQVKAGLQLVKSEIQSCHCEKPLK